MKSFSVLVLLIAISACNCATTVYESGVSGGSVLYSGTSKSAWESSWQSKKVNYPTILTYSAPIGYIKIVDNTDSSYSTATIRSGGIGIKHVQIEYYAPAFRAYDYYVEIRGLKKL